MNLKQLGRRQVAVELQDDEVIRIDGVSKQFMRGGGQVGDLRERFQHLRKSPPQEAEKSFWALRDVSVQVHRGECFGIVGHNGSGKSTLLKMLTGILQPTEGTLKVRGRIGALIEVGAGFHLELTGRENVYLSGSILGLSRQEIAARYDDIVRFADLAAYMDTPVKRYSSGMYMRLGFAVAAHTAPDVLLIDEVLAVGDTLFQRKCIRFLRDFVANGGTAVFVSHAMNQMVEVCDRCLWLDHGQVRFVGPTADAVDHYMALVAEREDEQFRRDHPGAWAEQEAEREVALRNAAQMARLEGERELLSSAERAVLEAQELVVQEQWRDDARRGRFTGVRLSDAAGQERTRVTVMEAIRFEVRYRLNETLKCPVFCLEIFREDDHLHMFSTNTHLQGVRPSGNVGDGTLVAEVPSMTLNAGQYYITLTLFPDYPDEEFHRYLAWEDKVVCALKFQVEPGTLGGHGCTYVPLQWEEVPTVPKESPSRRLPPSTPPTAVLLEMKATISSKSLASEPINDPVELVRLA